MANVKGMGGAFIYSNDAARLAAWYHDMLGVEMEAHPDGIRMPQSRRNRTGCPVPADS